MSTKTYLDYYRRWLDLPDNDAVESVELGDNMDDAWYDMTPDEQDEIRQTVEIASKISVASSKKLIADSEQMNTTARQTAAAADALIKANAGLIELSKRLYAVLEETDQLIAKDYTGSQWDDEMRSERKSILRDAKKHLGLRE